MTATGAQVLHLPPDSTGRVALVPLLTHLAAIGVNHVLVEGGTRLLGALTAAGLVDEVWAFIGPKLVGGAKAPGPLGDPGVARIADAQQLSIRRVERYDQDVLLVATATNVRGGRRLCGSTFQRFNVLPCQRVAFYRAMRCAE